jgi:hypothetical protein
VAMTALVLGMLMSTANSSYQDRKNELAEMGSNFVLVDGPLASHGPAVGGLGPSQTEKTSWPKRAPATVNLSLPLTASVVSGLRSVS